jgi:hypothetical protein
LAEVGIDCWFVEEVEIDLVEVEIDFGVEVDWAGIDSESAFEFEAAVVEEKVVEIGIVVGWVGIGVGKEEVQGMD